jgi:hypothetical protein
VNFSPLLPSPACRRVDKTVKHIINNNQAVKLRIYLCWKLLYNRKSIIADYEKIHSSLLRL